MAKPSFKITMSLLTVLHCSLLCAETGPAHGRIVKKDTATNGGGNTYFLDSEPFSPVEIIKDRERGGVSTKRGTILRDPGHSPGAVVKTPKAEAKKVERVRSSPATAKKTIRFRRVTVKGYHSDPRVEFSQDQLQLGRSDEPLQAQFLSRTFEEERDL